MATIRKKLSKVELTTYLTVRDELRDAGKAFEAAELRFKTVAALIFDHHGIDPEARGTVDEKTSEICVELPDPPVPEPAPAPTVEVATRSEAAPLH